MPPIANAQPSLAPPPKAVGRKALQVVEMGTVDSFGRIPKGRQLQSNSTVPFGTATTPYELDVSYMLSFPPQVGFIHFAVLPSSGIADWLL